MASSTRSDRTYHQDYIARIRYSNTLPPPPNPPKLLNIPGTGLAGGDFKSAKYASRLARDQILNIEADAELGLPIDLVGVPGVFTGDESNIQGLENPPPPHPHDRPLLRPIAALGKTSALASGVSFLRRTEYIASDSGRALLKPLSKDSSLSKQDIRKRKRDDEGKNNDPAKILLSMKNSFLLANSRRDREDGLELASEIPPKDRTAWQKPMHPSNPNLELIDEYPLLPDLSATTDAGSYILVKFQTNPVASSDSYDNRLDVGVLRPLQIDPEAETQYNAQLAAHQNDPTQPKPAKPNYEFEFFLPSNTESVGKIKSKMDLNNPRRDADDMYDAANEDSGRRFFSYNRLRAYETYQQIEDEEDPFGDTLAIALHDPDVLGGQNINLPKAAYFYPVSQRSYIRPRRNEKIARMGLGRAGLSQELDKVDILEVTIRDEDGNEQAARADIRSLHFENVVDTSHQ